MNPELTDYLSKFRERRRAALVGGGGGGMCGGRWGVWRGVGSGRRRGAASGRRDRTGRRCDGRAVRHPRPAVQLRLRCGQSHAHRQSLHRRAGGGLRRDLGRNAGRPDPAGAGALLGAIAGWILARALLALRHNVLRRFLFGIAGAALGTFAGALLWAVRLSPPAAPACAGRGLVIGAVAGPLLLLFVWAMWHTLARASLGAAAQSSRLIRLRKTPRRWREVHSTFSPLSWAAAQSPTAFAWIELACAPRFGSRCCNSSMRAMRATTALSPAMNCTW